MKKTYIIPKNKWAELDETELIAQSPLGGVNTGNRVMNQIINDDDDDNFFVIEQTNVWDDEW